MGQILGLVLPFFGLVLIGYLAAKATRKPLDGLAWMNFFIVYVALPALFFNLIARTPVDQLAQWGYIFATLLGTYCAFAIAFCVGVLATDGDIPESTIQGLSGAYGNIGYMGPGIAIAAFGPEAAVPIAIIFCFDNTLHFIMAPFMMAISGKTEETRPAFIALGVVKKVFTHPFIIATIVGVAAAWIQFVPPEPLQKLLDYLSNAAAPCALFAMGLTIALTPRGRVPLVMGPLSVIKLVVHPVLVYLLLSWVGDFDRVWVFTAVLLASLPTATNVFVIAQSYNVWVARASSMVLLTTVCSVVSVTGLLYAMTSGLLPVDLFPNP